MSPPRRSKTGLNFSTWAARQAGASVGKYKASVLSAGARSGSPQTAAGLMRRRAKAHRAIALKQKLNNALLQRNAARIERMLQQIENYKTRKPVILVRQPSGSLSMARGARGSMRRK